MKLTHAARVRQARGRLRPQPPAPVAESKPLPPWWPTDPEDRPAGPLVLRLADADGPPTDVPYLLPWTVKLARAEQELARALLPAGSNIMQEFGWFVLHAHRTERRELNWSCAWREWLAATAAGKRPE